jgi:S-adenosyl-L-methionine methyltransferase
VHSDLGSADSDCGPRLSAWLAGVLPLLVRPDGLVASDRELASAALLPLPPPAEPGDYFFHRRAA